MLTTTDSTQSSQQRDITSKRGRNSRKRRTRDIEQSITLGETYFIVYLLTNEVIKRGLTEPEIFSPVQTGSGVRHLINSLLRDDRDEFEEQLRFLHVQNIIAGIRMTLRNCNSPIISYESYEHFVNYEREWQNNPKSESFNQFLYYIPQKSQRILIKLFDLFAMTIEISHINKAHPDKILKSMSLCIFNESQTNTYENFQLAYYDWLKYSNALVHLFFAYLREKSYTNKLSEKLISLLMEDIKYKENDLIDDSNEGEIDHILPDPKDTIRSLDEVQISENVDSARSNMIIRSKSMLSYKTIRNNSQKTFKRRKIKSLYPMSKRKQSIVLIIDDPQSAEAKWSELQSRGLNLLSEEALRLLFVYDNLDPARFKDEKNKKERLNISIPIPLSRNSKGNDNNSCIGSLTPTIDTTQSRDGNSIKSTGSNATPNKNKKRKKTWSSLLSRLFSKKNRQIMNHKPVSIALSQEHSSVRQSSFEEHSIFGRYNHIKRGKELPYPLTPISRIPILESQVFLPDQSFLQNEIVYDNTSRRRSIESQIIENYSAPSSPQLSQRQSRSQSYCQQEDQCIQEQQEQQQ